MADENATDGVSAGDGQVFEAITSQEALDKIVAGRVSRVKQKFSDYAELKAKAETADALQVELDETRANIANAEIARKRYALAVEHGFNQAQVALLTASDDEGLEAQVEAIKSLKDGSSQMIVGAEGKTPVKGATSSADIFADVVRQMSN
jgi:hypothetical protein